MNAPREPLSDKEKAARAKRVIIVVMAVFMLLPILLAWLTGEIRF